MPKRPPPFSLITVLALLATTQGLSQETGEIRLVIQADDLGAGHGINVATIEAYKKGVVRTANVLMPAPWAPEAAALLKENPGLEAGVHLTLTSEWRTIKWRPLTLTPSLMDPFGYLYPAVKGPPGSARPSVSAGNPTVAEIERELRAQLDLAKKMIPSATYIMPHMGFTSYSPEVANLVARLAREYGLIYSDRDIPRHELGLVWTGRETAEARAAKIVEKLSTIGPGTWWMLDHLATDTPEMQAFGDNVAFDRSANLGAWTDPRVLEVVRKRGIRLMNHKEAFAAAGRP